nr:enoyl-CoA hydratase/isomerase family protein [Porphyrobacter sp.]
KTGDPAWNPATPEEVSEELLDAIFAPLPADEEWRPL